MEVRLSINDIDDLILNRKSLSFDSRLSEMTERISSNELIASLDNNIYGTVQASRDQSMRPFIHLKLQGCLNLVCQMCLEPFDYILNESVDLIIFKDNESLEKGLEKDPDIEGIISSNNKLNLLELIEDQIILAIPFSPKHEQCKNEQLNKLNENKINPFSLLKN